MRLPSVKLNLGYLYLIAKGAVIVSVIGVIALTILTRGAMRELPTDLRAMTMEGARPQVYDRHGVALSVTYQNRWNAHDQKALHRMPALMQSAMILAEDKRFYEHSGMDWRARFHAVLQNVLALDGVRGASTISEQAVRMIHSRPRTVWSRWVEGWEAAELERRFDKASILEFYLNQVPYAAQRRGVQQAARYYFDRDVSTLSEKEMFVLAVLVRAPSRFDLYKDPDRINGRLAVLLDRAQKEQLIEDSKWVQNQPLVVQRPNAPVDASHFIRYVLTLVNSETHFEQRTQVPTTLDASLQQTAAELLNTRLKTLKDSNVHNAGMLVIDHQTNEILAWAVGDNSDQRDVAFDAVRTKRQPGSTLKPFVYAAAIEKGWTAATMIDDSPLKEGVGRGVHEYRNYSNQFYGPISLRSALGNSLNIPAVKAAKFVGLNPLLNKFHQLGLTELDLRSVDYGNGIALGNGEVSLLSMANAYATLARNGQQAPLKVRMGKYGGQLKKPVFSPEVSSLVAHILSDPDARALEFGRGGVLNLPVQTAIKTGTSTDYRDAWVFGFNHRYLIGIWMGNLDNQPMDNVTGSRGPALVLRSMFFELNKHERGRPLYLSPRLVRKEVCIYSVQSDSVCRAKSEYFIKPSQATESLESSKPGQQANSKGHASNSLEPALKYQITQPLNKSQLAFDPRIPVDLQQLKFELNTVEGIDRVEWEVNESSLGDSEYWSIERGDHILTAKLFTFAEPSNPIELSSTFSVK